MFTKLNKIVTEVLFDYPGTRDDDNLLYIKVIDRIHPGITKKTLEEVMPFLKSYKLPPFESVSRARRKIQELRKDLRGSEKVEDERRQQEFNYWIYYGRK